MQEVAIGARRGLLIILSSPSGAGKSTLARRLRDWDNDIVFSVSATTRPARQGEVDGADYHFMDEPTFRAMIKAGEMLEYAHIFGHHYGSPKGPINDAIAGGRDVLFDIDWQGAQQIRTSSLAPHALSIFLLPPSLAELRRRLVERGQDDKETIQGRMKKSWDEISHWDSYDFVLINDDLDKTEKRLRTIIESTRLRLVQQAGLSAHVRRLQTEFEEMS